MDTESWLIILLIISVTVGTCMYHFGHAIGKEQNQIDVEARRASMRRHPSNHIRLIKE